MMIVFLTVVNLQAIAVITYKQDVT